MTRRTFLAILAGLTAVGSVAVGVGRRLGPRPLGPQLGRLEGFGRTPAARLRGHFAWLNVDAAAFDSYLSDYQTHFGPLGRFSIPEDKFFTRFLLSTDFYSNGAERPRNGGPVSYMVLYEPNTSSCYNPLALPPPSDSELARTGLRFPG